MPQLHFSVDQEEAERLNAQAAARGVSVSKYIASLLRQHTLRETWPEGYLEAVVGCCKQVPLERPASLPLDDIDL
ncbi:MAG: hypothetical protein ACPGUV_14275 [Polyangiales bacterium]